MKRPPLAIPLRSVTPGKPLTRRQWERQQIADAFVVFGLSIDSIAATVPGPKRWSLSVTLKGRRAVSNLPEIQPALNRVWAEMLPSKSALGRGWEHYKVYLGWARDLGRAARRSMDEDAARVLRGAGG